MLQREPHLEDVLIRYDNLATRIWCMVVDRLPNLSRHVHEHVDLLEAVIAGDEARSAELARITSTASRRPYGRRCLPRRAA